jgi:hypothetical protein
MSDELSSTSKVLIELARTREILRSYFPLLAHKEYGSAQKDPYMVSIYMKACFLEATKKGLIESPIVHRDLSLEEGL